MKEPSSCYGRSGDVQYDIVQSREELSVEFPSISKKAEAEHRKAGGRGDGGKQEAGLTLRGSNIPVKFSI